MMLLEIAGFGDALSLILGILQFLVSSVASVLMCILVFKLIVRWINTIKMKGPSNVNEDGTEKIEYNKEEVID